MFPFPHCRPLVFLSFSWQKFPSTRTNIRWPWAKMHNLTQWLLRWKQEPFLKNALSHTLSCPRTSSNQQYLQSISKLGKSWSVVNSTWMKCAISYLKSRLVVNCPTLPMECRIDQPKRLYSSTFENIKAKSRYLLRKPPIILKFLVTRHAIRLFIVCVLLKKTTRETYGQDIDFRVSWITSLSPMAGKSRPKGVSCCSATSLLESPSEQQSLREIPRA